MRKNLKKQALKVRGDQVEKNKELNVKLEEKQKETQSEMQQRMRDERDARLKAEKEKRFKG